WGTMRMVRLINRNRTTITATTMPMSSPAIAYLLPGIHQGGRALDVHYVDSLPGRDDLSFVVRTSRPHLAADADPAAVRPDLLEHGGGPAARSGSAAAQQWGLPARPHSERRGHAEPQGGRGNEDAELDGGAPAEEAGSGRQQRRDAQQPERKRG